MSDEWAGVIEALPLGKGVRVIRWNGDGLAALDKPPGIMSHPNKEADRSRSLLDASYDYEAECFSWEDGGETRRAWLVNRLDSPTSGVILLVVNEALKDIIKLEFSTHRVRKVYQALVRHLPPTPAGTWKNELRKDISRGGRVMKKAQRVRAKTRYQVSKSTTGGFPVCQLKLLPVTGRTHQLRVQCKKNGHPIVGDRTYGHFPFNREVRAETGEDRMMLHSAEIHVRYAFWGKPREFHAESELPEAFGRVLGYRPGMRMGGPGGGPPRAAKKAARGAVAGRRFRA